jgi:hypothetical protein
MKIFDYIFYRIAKFYFKKDGTHASTAVTLLSVFQSFLINIIFLLVVKSNLNSTELSNSTRTIGYFGAFITVIVILLNYYRYNKKYLNLRDRWYNYETTFQNRIRGALILFAFIISIFLFFLVLLK